MMDEFIYCFKEEAGELLHQLEDNLITLENNPGNREIINNIFRVMHTLKGSAGMVGFKNIQDLTHEFEEIYEKIREGILTVNNDIINITLQGKDLLLNMLNGEKDQKAAEIMTGLISNINKSRKKILQLQSLENSFKTKSSGHFYVLLFTPDKTVFERGLNPDRVIDDLRSKGETYIILHEKRTSWEKQKVEKICNTVWEIYLRTPAKVSDLEEIFTFYDEDEFQLFEISPAQSLIDPLLAENLKKLYKKKVEPEQHLIECIKQLPDKEAVQEIKPEMTNANNSAEPSRIDAMVNVSSHKLDELMNLVSELVTLTATIQSQVSGLHDPKINNSIEKIEKLTKGFRNNALDLRLVPVGSLLTKFKRQVRDLSQDLGKKVNLLIEGQEIEIDKTILKSIESPLQHIIRNSIDHGIEMEEERLKKGKSPEGLLKIMVFYSGASVIIQVQDDGSGINLDRVKECAIKKGLIQADQVVSKQELLNFIMEPGFTTSENISMVSGRGVGMDVVRKELGMVSGSLEVFTEKDLGTSITMKLPTTLTIIDTLMVDVADTIILIPVMDIEYCFKEEIDKLFKKDNKYIEYKNNPIPLISLREQFKYPDSDRKDTMVIVINKFDRRYALTADEIVGEHQAVIKPLGGLFVNQPYFSGGSIMVDGKLAFILDTNFLFNHVTKL